MDINTDPVIAEMTYDSPKAVVWKAITDPVQMRQWFFEPMTDFQPKVGFETQFNVQVEGQDYLHLWKLTEVVPETRIVYDWRYEGYPGSSTLAWELLETAKGTHLKLTHSGIETFSSDNPIFSRESAQGGWDYFVQSLKDFLEP